MHQCCEWGSPPRNWVLILGSFEGGLILSCSEKELLLKRKVVCVAGAPVGWVFAVAGGTQTCFEVTIATEQMGFHLRGQLWVGNPCIYRPVYLGV